MSELSIALEVQMKLAANYQPYKPTSTATADSLTAVMIWATSISGIIKLVIDKALELGKEYRSQIESSAKLAVDAVVAWDLPWIPEGIENTLDEVTRSAGYAAITAMLNAILGPRE